MEIYGYKAFNKDLTNRYGFKFEVGKSYKVNGEIKFGNDGNGFHLCENIEDTLRYFDAMNDEVDICLVKGSGMYDEHYDDYYGYYDMFCTEELEIIKKLTRREIIEIVLNLNELRAKRFVSLFRLTNDEINLFIKKFQNNKTVIDSIHYYQNVQNKVYIKKYKNGNL